MNGTRHHADGCPVHEDAREIRIPGYSTGDDLGGEPSSWLIIDRETGGRRYEMNPNYVPPPPPSEYERAEQRVADAVYELEEARRALADLASGESAPEGEGK